MRRNLSYMDGYFYHEAEFIILENGSKNLAGKFAYTEARYVQRDQPGLGWALREGIRRSSNEKVVFLPADMSYDLDFVPRALTHLQNGTDIVIGSKMVKGSEVERPLKRKVLSELYSFYVNYVHNLSILDVTGTKGFKKSKVAPLLDSCGKDGIAFEVQLLKAAKKAGLRVKEIPVKVNDFRKSRFLT
ncbi:MAG: glycosyltransferase [Thaumarchaeota archaeon]|nr:glycosyltransferase [Nitrososphaerota archaeon]